MSEQLSYTEVCQAYAIGQGLKPIMDALTTKGADWDLWQSGGFCMVVTVRQENTAGGYLGEWGITYDGEDTWVVCWYEGGTDEEQPDDVPTLYITGVDEVITKTTSSSNWGV